jgi:hypothetical protein
VSTRTVLRTLGAAALIAILHPASASAQLSELEPGSRVRVTTDFGRIVGIYKGVVRDSVEVIEPDGAVRRAAYFRVVKVEKSNGITAKAGAAKGTRLGVILGFIFGSGYFLAKELTESFVEPAGSTQGSIDIRKIFGGMLIGGFIGGVSGSIIGSNRKAEDWRQVYPIQ